jgi:hypothetical protein
MMRIFISQPLGGRPVDDILNERSAIINHCRQTYGDDIEIIDSYDAEFYNHNIKPLECLGESIIRLSSAHVAIFARGWEEFRGCRLEHMACKEYGIKTVELMGHV